MRRIRTEILLHTHLPEIWILELLEDEQERFIIQRHWGHTHYELTSRLDHTDECELNATELFEKKVNRKIKRERWLRQARPGETIYCEDLLRIFGNDVLQKPVEKPPKQNEQPTPEYRKLRL